MLNLGVPTRTIGGVELAADDEDDLAFYVLPASPAVAGGAAGSAALVLTRFVAGQLLGGHLDLTVELPNRDEALAAARAALADSLRVAPEKLSLRPLPLTGASASLLFVGRDTDETGELSPLLARSYGEATPTLDAPHRAHFSVPLTVDGVRLVEAALRSGGAPIGVIYRLQCEGLRLGQQVVATVDWSRVYSHFSSEFKQGQLFVVTDVQKLVERLIAERAVVIRAVQAAVGDGSTPPPDLGPAIDWVTREVIERMCQPIVELAREPASASLGTVGEMFGVGTRYQMKALVQAEAATADLALERNQAVTRTFTAAAHLADLLGDGDASGHIVDADTESPFFARAGLHLATARPLAASFVRELAATFRYGSDAIPIVLDGQHADGSASTWADHDASHTWQLALAATLSDDAPLDPGTQVTLPTLSGQSWDLVLDVDQLLGLVRIEVHGSPDERVMATRVTVAQLRGGEPLGDGREVALDAKHAVGAAWFRDVRPDDRLQAHVRHILKDGRLLDQPPLPVETRLLRLPAAYPGWMALSIITDDEWDDVSTIIVVVQKSADQAPVTLTFDKPGASAAVRLDLPDPLDRSYRYQVTRLRNGNRVQDDWLRDDHSVLLVGATPGGELVVDVAPVGVELPSAGISLIEVQLQYIDVRNQLRDEQTAVIRALADKFHWVVALKDPAQRSYQYRVVVHGTRGDTRMGAWQTSSERVLPIPVVAG